jgi:DNA (cytosine-5)-methyltransferase 1
VLDAQYFGLAQRRRRVFVVGHLGDWRRAAAVLFERESLSGHPAPRRQTRQDVTAGTLRSTDGGSDCDHAAAAHLVAHALRSDGFDASEDGTGRGTPIVPVTHALDSYSAGRATEDGTGRGCPIVPIAFSAKDYGADVGDIAPTLRAGGHAGSHANGGCMPAIAFDARQSDVLQYGDMSGLLDTDGHTIAVALRGRDGGGAAELSEIPSALRASQGGGDKAHVLSQMQVRRLTPRECERLQGFPDDYTLIPYRGKPAADGPRYKALGNSMAVPCMAWIGRRIQLVTEVTA